METWMNQTWWLYDLTVIAIVTLCIWGGWRRGLIRTAAGLLGYGAALLLSGVLGTAGGRIGLQSLAGRRHATAFWNRRWSSTIWRTASSRH